MKRVVLCGFGRFGRVYAQRSQEHSALDVVGVVELAAVHDAVRAAGFRPFDSLGEALDVTHPQLVVVATPPANHAALAVEALQRYVDVMLAKPGALGVDEADRVCSAAWERGRRVVVDWTPMWSASWQRLRAVPWPDGILSVRMVRRGVQAYQDCGVLWDLAPHDVALALDLMPDDRVVDVGAHAWWYPGYDEPVGAWVMLTHASGRTTRIEVDWMAATTERRVEIVEHERMHVWDQLTDMVGWTRRGYRCDDKGVVRGVWDLEPQLHASLQPEDNITRALSRAVSGVDDSERFREVVRILEAAEVAIYAGSERVAA